MCFMKIVLIDLIARFSDGEWSSILSVLCSIYHLGTAGKSVRIALPKSIGLMQGDSINMRRRRPSLHKFVKF